MIKLYTEWATLKNGIVIPGEIKLSHSWVKGTAQVFSAMMGDDDTLSVRDTSNALFTLDETDSSLDITAAAADTTHGILVGTGTTAVAKDDHTIETLIAEGAGGGQLNYQAQLISVAFGISGGYRVTLSRQVDNNSGGTVTVEECGLANVCVDTGAGSRNVLLLHDLQTQAILDTESKIFKYHLDFLI